jgi:cytochrome c-type biogenesis protein
MVGVSALACSRGGDDGGYRRIAEGEPAPSFTGATLAGDSVSLDSLRGDVVLLNIWATWCLPCRREMPGLQALHERYGDRGLRVLGVSIDARSATESVDLFLKDYGITFTILHDPTEGVTRRFRSIGVPETFLIARDGRILKRWIGRFEPEAETTVDLVEAELRRGQGQG